MGIEPVVAECLWNGVMTRLVSKIFVLLFSQCIHNKKQKWQNKIMQLKELKGLQTYKRGKTVFVTYEVSFFVLPVGLFNAS